MGAEATKSDGQATVGVVQIVIGMGGGLFAYAHRPSGGIMDAIQRSDSWAFGPGIYYTILVIAALFTLAGILHIVPERTTARTANDGTRKEFFLDRIRKGKELLDAGAINAEEFAKIKKDVLEE